MATDLGDRLGDLASHTPPGSPPADLWQRGVRRGRLARAGAAGMVVALVALLGLGGWSWRLDHTRVEPVAPQEAPHLPDRFYTPSPWLPAFDGPPGPLVAVMTSARKSLLHTGVGLVGVTAATGQYGFLDLPDATVNPGLSDGWVSIAPDGGHVAYWTRNRATGAANGVGSAASRSTIPARGRHRSIRSAASTGWPPRRWCGRTRTRWSSRTDAGLQEGTAACRPARRRPFAGTWEPPTRSRCGYRRRRGGTASSPHAAGVW